MAKARARTKTDNGDSDVLHVIMHANELRSGSDYRHAFHLLRKKGKRGAATMASSDERSEDHSAIRLLIGTWNSIAMTAEHLDNNEIKRFFRTQPVALMWKNLSPGVEV